MGAGDHDGVSGMLCGFGIVLDDGLAGEFEVIAFFSWVDYRTVLIVIDSGESFREGRVVVDDVGQC